jgi:hypothetical protein
VHAILDTIAALKTLTREIPESTPMPLQCNQNLRQRPGEQIGVEIVIRVLKRCVFFCRELHPTRVRTFGLYTPLFHVRMRPVRNAIEPRASQGRGRGRFWAPAFPVEIWVGMFMLFRSLMDEPAGPLVQSAVAQATTRGSL